MESLGLFTLVVPSTGIEVTGEKIRGPHGIYFQVGSNTFREGELEEVGIAPKGKLPTPINLPWNQA